LAPKPWVKTSLAPGSQVVTEYLKSSGLQTDLDKIGFNLVGYGCTTCIGKSGPLPENISDAIRKNDLVAAAVLSGNRNFEGRVNPDVRANYLASPPLVVAYALAGSLNVNIASDPLGHDGKGRPVYLKDIWPGAKEIADFVRRHVTRKAFARKYKDVFKGDAQWRRIKVGKGLTYGWDAQSTYVANPPYFDGLTMQPAAVADIHGARILGLFLDSITTDHISPAGDIKAASPAGLYLMGRGIAKLDFNSYGARRGHHEVMMRGTFANIRIKNQMVPGVEGGFTMHYPSFTQMPIYDAAMKYQAEGVPLVIFAGREYGTGSSRDWAAKGTLLLGVRAVIAESFERIHRSNLVGMGVLPLEFLPGQSRATLALTGQETFDVRDLPLATEPRRTFQVVATAPDGRTTTFEARSRVDTPVEAEWLRHGGVLPYVLRKLLA
jgi:aconitate hydratase